MHGFNSSFLAEKIFLILLLMYFTSPATFSDHHYFFSTNALFATSRMRFDIKFFRLYSQKVLTAEGFIVLFCDQTI